MIRLSTRTRALAVAAGAAAVLGVATAAPAGATHGARTYTLPGDNVFPEGIASSGTTFYVTSTGTGTVYRGEVDEPATEVFLPGGEDGRVAAVGLKVAGDKLVVAGGATGFVWVYDRNTGDLVRRFSNDAAAAPTFLNDVAIAPNGDAYVTDSMRDVLYRIPAADLGTPAADAALPVFLTWTAPVNVIAGQFNMNGIVATPDGQYLLVVQSNTGKLWRVRVADKSVTQVDVVRSWVQRGDGMYLEGDTLYVLRNALNRVVKYTLNADFSVATKASSRTNAAWNTPTTLTSIGDRLLLVNSQFNNRETGAVLPFTVTSIAQF